MSDDAEWSRLAMAMLEAIESHRTRKVPFEVLARSAAAVDDSGVGTPSWRQRLADAVEELERGGAVELPSVTSSRSWDRATDPMMPQWIRRPAPPRGEHAPEAPVVWDAELAFAGRLELDGGLSEGERRLLVAVNDWLRHQDSGAATMVPIRERSWELLGDEKVLERLRRGRLFAPGRLTDELLAVEPQFAPVDAAAVGRDPARTWVVVENWTTYRTIEWAAGRCGWSGTVLWSAGNQAVARVEAAADELARPAALFYFGDIDRAGLRLAHDVVRTAAALGLPSVSPATGMYRLLLDAGEPVPAARRRRVPESLAAWLSDWLADSGLSAAALAVAEVGRMPQEAVGRQLLAGRDIDELLGPTG